MPRPTRWSCAGTDKAIGCSWRIGLYAIDTVLTDATAVSRCVSLHPRSVSTFWGTASGPWFGCFAFLAQPLQSHPLLLGCREPVAGSGERVRGSAEARRISCI